MLIESFEIKIFNLSQSEYLEIFEVFNISNINFSYDRSENKIVFSLKGIHPDVLRKNESSTFGMNSILEKDIPNMKSIFEVIEKIKKIKEKVRKEDE